MKDEPQWMLDFRLKAYEHFRSRPMPTWGPDLSGLDLENIFYYVKPTQGSEKSWDNVPDDIKNTFNKLGIPEAEQKFLAGVGAQYESEMVYHSIQEHLEKAGCHLPVDRRWSAPAPGPVPRIFRHGHPDRR
jgi:Fe-S cluster assembly protein SufB